MHYMNSEKVRTLSLAWNIKHSVDTSICANYNNGVDFFLAFFGFFTFGVASASGMLVLAASLSPSNSALRFPWFCGYMISNLIFRVFLSGSLIGRLDGRMVLIIVRNSSAVPFRPSFLAFSGNIDRRTGGLVSRLSGVFIPWLAPFCGAWYLLFAGCKGAFFDTSVLCRFIKCTSRRRHIDSFGTVKLATFTLFVITSQVVFLPESPRASLPRIKHRCSHHWNAMAATN